MPRLSSVAFSTAFEMRTHLRQRYQPPVTLSMSMVHQEHALQQGDSTVDDFYAQNYTIWRQLDSLCIYWLSLLSVLP